MKHIFFLVLASILLLPSFGQQANRQAAGGQGQAAAEKQPDVGIRFALIDSISQRTIYIPVDEKNVRKINLRMGLPSGRIEYPANGKLMIYNVSPIGVFEEGKEPELLIESQIPATRSPKMLGLIGQLADGKLYIMYIEDANLVPGVTLFKNLTNLDYLIDVPTSPRGETNRFTLKKGGEYLYGKNITSRQTQTFGATLMLQTNVQGEMRWMTNRKFMITCTRTKAYIKIFLPDPVTGGFKMMDIALVSDRAVDPARSAIPFN